jgi:hypothetical protein
LISDELEKESFRREAERLRLYLVLAEILTFNKDERLNFELTLAEN